MGGFAATQRIATSATTVSMSKWTIPWGVGRPSTADLVVNVRDSTNTNPLIALRCLYHIRVLWHRSEIPSSTFIDISFPTDGSLSVLNGGLITVLTATTSGETSTILMVPDLIGMDHDARDIISVVHSAGGQFSPDADQSRLVGSSWINTATGAPGDNRRVIACVYP